MLSLIFVCGVVFWVVFGYYKTLIKSRGFFKKLIFSNFLFCLFVCFFFFFFTCIFLFLKLLMWFSYVAIKFFFSFIIQVCANYAHHLSRKYFLLVS